MKTNVVLMGFMLLIAGCSHGAPSTGPTSSATVSPVADVDQTALPDYPTTIPNPVFRSTDYPGKHILIKDADLPAPFATPSTNNGSRIVHEPSTLLPQVPPGFAANVFASGLTNPRNMTVAPNGDIFVACSALNEVIDLRDTKGTGVADQQTVFAQNLRQPFGLGFHGKYLYVGNTDSIVRFAYTPGDTVASGAPVTVVPNLPANGYNNHWTRDLLFSADGKTMFVSVGSKENVGIDEPRRAAILAFDPDGGSFRIYASGLRNPVGLALCPDTGKLWASVNERDTLGNEVPPDYATEVQENGFYGWPYAYIGPHPDPHFGSVNPAMVQKTLIPDVLLEAHCAAVNIRFSTSSKFPKLYRHGAFVSMHGSWNRLPRVGYKVVFIPTNIGRPVDGGYVNFLTGFVLPDESVWGRPVGLQFAADGSLLVCDDAAGKIWRVTYTGKP